LFGRDGRVGKRHLHLQWTFSRPYNSIDIFAHRRCAMCLNGSIDVENQMRRRQPPASTDYTYTFIASQVLDIKSIYSAPKPQSRMNTYHYNCNPPDTSSITYPCEGWLRPPCGARSCCPLSLPPDLLYFSPMFSGSSPPAALTTSPTPVDARALSAAWCSFELPRPPAVESSFWSGRATDGMMLGFAASSGTVAWG
jgi:hypothetical protein